MERIIDRRELTRLLQTSKPIPWSWVDVDLRRAVHRKLMARGFSEGMASYCQLKGRPTLLREIRSLPTDFSDNEITFSA